MFNKVSKQLHPDKGGSKEAFVALFDEYEQAQERFSPEHGADSTPEMEEGVTPSCDANAKRSSARTRWWAHLPQEQLWDLLKKEQKANEAFMQRLNAESILREEYAYDCVEYTEEQRALIRIDYDRLGSVAELAAKRQEMSSDDLLAEMKRKREQKSSGTVRPAIVRVGFSEFFVEGDTEKEEKGPRQGEALAELPKCMASLEGYDITSPFPVPISPTQSK